MITGEYGSIAGPSAERKYMEYGQYRGQAFDDDDDDFDGIQLESTYMSFRSLLWGASAEKQKDGTYGKFTLGKRDMFENAYDRDKFFSSGMLHMCF